MRNAITALLASGAFVACTGLEPETAPPSPATDRVEDLVVPEGFRFQTQVTHSLDLDVSASLLGDQAAALVRIRSADGATLYRGPVFGGRVTEIRFAAPAALDEVEVELGSERGGVTARTTARLDEEVRVVF